MNTNQESRRKRLKRDVNNNNNNSKNRMILRSDVKDRISQLPDHLLHYILSFLTAEEAARMSVLSNTWCHVRASYPHLTFNRELFWHCEKSEFSKEGDKFMNIVNDNLLKFCKQKVSMEKFQLFAGLHDVEHTIRVNHWMKLAIENCVKEIDLFILTGKEHIRYSLPQTLFAAKTLTVLKLWGCQFKYPLLGDTTSSLSLRELSLVNIHADEHIISNFIFSCPLIENLVVVRCRRVKNLRLSGLVKLKKVELLEHDHDQEKFDSIEIVELPTLQALLYESWHVACKIDETSLKNLEVLDLKMTGITDQLLEFLISRCTLLKSLMIYRGYKLKGIKISSHRLKHLKLFYLLDLKHLTIDAPNLHTFEYSGDIKQFLFSMDTSSIRKATLRICRQYSDNFLFSRLREYLGKLSQDTDLTLHFICQKVRFSPTILRGTSIPALWDVKHLKLTVEPVYNPVTTEKDYENLVDGLFWCSHPQTLSFIAGWKGSNEFLKVLCENMVKRRQKKSCCSPRDIKCWRHYLKKVWIESFPMANGKKVISCRSLLKSLPLLRPEEKIIFKLTWQY